MPEHDDEIREAFRAGRDEDREAAPSFGATWGAASEKPGRGRWLAAGMALAAAALLIFVLLPSGEQAAEMDGEIAQTNPKPDVPVTSGAPREGLDLAPISDEAFADWEADSYDAPTDFLLESDGVLAGGMPSSEWEEPVLDFGETLDTTEL